MAKTPPDPTAGPIEPAGRPRILVATRSPHKLRELRQLLRPARAELVSLAELGLTDDPVEDRTTFEGNAALKARYYARRTGLPTLADDSGLEVEALGGAPGVRTRRFAGPDPTDEENNRRLLELLGDRPPEERRARYVAVLALALPHGTSPRGGIPVRLARGTFRGRIAVAPRGSGGFGYDPIFEPAFEPPGGRTVAEMTAEEKNRISHRARAAARMARILAELGW